MNGWQLGVVNSSLDATGFRFGVVNATRNSKGFSFGVVNVAKHDDGESFALVNVVGNGIHDVSVFATDVMAANFGFKLGGRHLYTNLIAGYQPGDQLTKNLTTGADQYTANTERFATGVGIGWRFPVERGPLAHLELEADWLEIRPVWSWTSNPPAVGSLRLQAGLNIAPHVLLLAGAGVNVALATDSKVIDLNRIGLESELHSGETTVRIYPGLLVGLQI
jgi:hypothetical protein